MESWILGHGAEDNTESCCVAVGKLTVSLSVPVNHTYIRIYIVVARLYELVLVYTCHSVLIDVQ